MTTDEHPARLAARRSMDAVTRGAKEEWLALFAPDAVVHLAAESHVDRSIDGPAAFVSTNVVGTCVMLEAALAYWRGLPAERRDRFCFVHVSTDEVYGSLGPQGRFTEASRYDPNSPYAASKAAADQCMKAVHVQVRYLSMVSTVLHRATSESAVLLFSAASRLTSRTSSSSSACCP